MPIWSAWSRSGPTDGLEALEEQPLGGDPAAALPSVDVWSRSAQPSASFAAPLPRRRRRLAARRLTIATLRYSISAMRRALLVGLATLAVVGCGASAKDEPAQAGEEPSVSVSQPPSGPSLTRPEYFEAVRAIVDGRAGDATALFNALVAGQLSPKECGQTAEEFGRVLDDIVEQAAALSPPAHVAELHEKFVVAAGKAVPDAQLVLARVEAGALACGEPLNEEIYGLPATKAAERVLSRIEAKGYVIFGQ